MKIIRATQRHSNQIKAVLELGRRAFSLIHQGEAEMTNAEFDQAIAAIRQGQITPHDRRIVAAVLMMRELCNMPEDRAWEPTHTQIVEFINSLDKHLRRILKRVADDVKEGRHTLH